MATDLERVDALREAINNLQGAAFSVWFAWDRLRSRDGAKGDDIDFAMSDAPVLTEYPDDEYLRWSWRGDLRHARIALESWHKSLEDCDAALKAIPKRLVDDESEPTLKRWSTRLFMELEKWRNALRWTMDERGGRVSLPAFLRHIRECPQGAEAIDLARAGLNVVKEELLAVWRSVKAQEDANQSAAEQSLRPEYPASFVRLNVPAAPTIGWLLEQLSNHEGLARSSRFADEANDLLGQILSVADVKLLAAVATASGDRLTFTWLERRAAQVAIELGDLAAVNAMTLGEFFKCITGRKNADGPKPNRNAARDKKRAEFILKEYDGIKTWTQIAKLWKDKKGAEWNGKDLSTLPDEHLGDLMRCFWKNYSKRQEPAKAAK